MKYIKKFSKYTLLLEKLYHIDDDVNMLYDKYFKKALDEITFTGKVYEDMFEKATINTSVLENDLCIKANEINPCKILINAGFNAYKPSENTIFIGISNKVIWYVLDQGNGFIKDAIKRIPTNQKNMFLQEFTEHKFKGSIHHELTHWIDDTLNNNHINRYVTKYENKFAKEYSSGNINANYLERQAQIHNIKQLYNSHKLIWDSLTFQEMLNLSPTLVFLFRRLSEDDKKQWTKDIKKRMFRENLLGKMMK